MLINLTAHNINFLDEDNQLIDTISPYGVELRLESTLVRVGDIEGIPHLRAALVMTQEVPPQTEGVIYITSKLVVEYLNDREDFFYPCDMVRDGQRILGCRGLTRG